MYIKRLHIDAFGPLRGRVFDLSPGLTIVEGLNESGKSSLAMFIKFMLYGLSGKSVGGEMTERRRYVNWETGTAAGSMVLVTEEGTFRIERLLSVSLSADGGREIPRDALRIIHVDTGTQLPKGQVPGEVLCGVPENIFMNTVFVRQIDGARINSTGMLSSIENLLFTADETVGTKKAMERLDDARRQLLHKNGGGGLLFDLREQRNAVAAALRDAEERAKTLREAKTAYAEVKTLTDALAADVKKQEIICRCGAINVAKRRFDTVNAAEKKLSEMRARLAKAEAEGADRAYLTELTETKRGLDRTAEAVDRLTNAREQAAIRLKAVTADDEAKKQTIQTAENEALSLSGRRRGFTAAALTSLILALLAGGLSAFFAALSVDPFWGPLSVSGILLLAGTVCLILRGKTQRALRDLLDRWGAESAEGISEAVKQQYKNAEDPETVLREKEMLEASRKAAEAERRNYAEKVFRLAARLDESAEEKRARAEDDTELLGGALALLDDLLPKAEEKCQQIEALTREVNTFEGRLSLLKEQLSKEKEEEIRALFARNMDTVEGRIASGMDAAKLEEARLKLDTLKQSLSAATEKRHRMETALAADSATAESPALLKDRLLALDEEIEETSLRHEAYCLAMDTLRDASETMRASVLPEVITEASASLNRMSGGAFDAIGIDQDLSMTFTRGSQTREVEFLSEGTKDMAYLSLRRALTGVLFGGRRPPLIYDESFARMDGNRLARALDLLAQQGENTQSILLTCRHLEAELSENAQIINL